MASSGDGKIDEIFNSLSAVNKSSFSSDLERRLALIQAERLVTRLQTPYEVATKLLHTDVMLVGAVKSLIALDLFAKWEKDGSNPKTLEQLARLTGAEAALLERLLRSVTISGLLSTNEKDDSGRDLYLFTEHAKAFAEGDVVVFWLYHTFVASHCGAAVPEYLKKSNFREPIDAMESPWADRMGKPFMDFLQGNPYVFSLLNGLLALRNENNIPWYTFYPAKELVNGTQGPVLVDIGGGTGQDIKTFQQQFASELSPGQLVLQDLEQVVVEAGELPPAIHKQSYDFFTTQPVKGARAYFMHSVLHDWPLDKCLEILARIKEAMKPGYSRLLINENVLSLQSTPFASSTDLAMMSLNSGKERTVDEWRAMLEAAGLRLVKIYTSPAIDEAVIEAEV